MKGIRTLSATFLECLGWPQIFNQSNDPIAIVALPVIFDIGDILIKRQKSWEKSLVFRMVSRHNSLLLALFLKEWEIYSFLGVVMRTKSTRPGITESHEVGYVFRLLHVERLKINAVESSEEDVVNQCHFGCIS
jgi:hypothetical protein